MDRGISRIHFRNRRQGCFGLLVLLLIYSITASAVEFKEGSIGQTLDLLPDNPPTDEYPFLKNLPIEVLYSTGTFPASDIDSASGWIYLPDGNDSSIRPLSHLIERFYPGFNSTRAMLFMGTKNQVHPITLFDGYVWKVYEFPLGIRPTAMAWSPSLGIVFGNNDEMTICCGEGNQGVCHLSEQGIISRLFWPPLLRRWQDKDKRLNETRDIWSETRNIWSLQFSSANTLWVGMDYALIRLDFDSDSWTLYDEYNSLIQGRVLHIAKVQGKNLIRCLCLNPVGENWISAVGRMVRIEPGKITEEPLPADARKAIPPWGPIVSDSSGTIWFVGIDRIWRSDLNETRPVIELPDLAWRRNGNDLYSDRQHLWVDTSERVWFADKRDLWILGSEGWLYLHHQVFDERANKGRQINSIGEDLMGRIWVSWSWDTHQHCVSVLGRAARAQLEDSIGPPHGVE